MVDTYVMTRSRASACVSVGITNARLGADKRGIAVELAQRLARTSNAPVCLVGADPTDRDVERRRSALVSGGPSERMQIVRGPHFLDVTYVPQRRLYVVSLSDRTAVESVLPELRAMFEYVIIDAPSRVGNGVGISRVLLPHLDSLLIASGLTAPELALTRGYLEVVEAMAYASHLDVGVVLVGHPDDSGLAPDQLERRTRMLPIVGHVPRLWGRVTRAPAFGDQELDVAFEPMSNWIRARRPSRTAEDPVQTPHSPQPVRSRAAPVMGPTRTARLKHAYLD